MTVFDGYKFVRNNDLVYQFDSIGLRGSIRKIVTFSNVDEIPDPSFYFLHFGDFKEGETTSIDYTIRTDNRDTSKVIHTIFLIALDFLKRNPEFTVLFLWKDDIRIRFFTYWICKNFDLYFNHFYIFGQRANGKWERFKPRQKYFGVYGKLRQ